MVQEVRTISSNKLFDNKNDESRVYEIEAHVNIREGAVDSLDSGNVFRDGSQVANFNSWKNNRLNITYQGVDLEERNAINVAVDAFIGEVKESVLSNAE